MVDESRISILRSALTTSRGPLIGPEAYDVLHALNIAVAPYIMTQSPEDAMNAADRLGYPVVLKIVSQDILHKSEVGAVSRVVRTQKELVEARSSILAQVKENAPYAKVSGIMLQSEAKGIEVIVGGKRDRIFGPTVLFGLGGIWVEILRDVSIRLCPMTSAKARQMIEEIKAFPLLAGFRNSPKADLNSIVHVINAVSSTLLNFPEISEFEINPLIVGSEGSGSFAVDARIIFIENKSTERVSNFEEKQPRLAGEAFWHLFEAKSIAFVGGSKDYSKVGGRIVSRILKHGYEGKLVIVNPRETAVFRSSASIDTSPQTFLSLEDIPFEIEAALIVVPAEASLTVMEQCARKGVKFAAVYATGFAETESGMQREKHLVQAASVGSTRFVGPNILGLMRPSSKVFAEFTSYEGKMEAGNVGFASQSGGVGSSLATEAVERGLGVSALISTGNEADLDIADAIDYFVKDSETKVLVCYLENVKNGQKLIMAASEALQSKKPIIVYKAGISQLGQSQAKSHTGAVAVDDNIFDALVKEYGMIRVDNLYTTLEVAKAFSMQPIPRGNKLAIVSGSGGVNVIATDILSERNTVIPELSENTQVRLRKFFPDTSVRNPVDVSASVVGAPKLVGETINTILQDENIDALIVVVTTFSEAQGRIISEDICKAQRFRKPILVVWPFPRSSIGEHIRFLQEEHRVPVYLSIEDAARSIDAMIQYSKLLQKE